MPDGQLTIPMPAQIRRRESKAEYCAVLRLRRAGYRVYRSGRWCHKIDGKLASPGQLLGFALAAPDKVDGEQ